MDDANLYAKVGLNIRKLKTCQNLSIQELADKLDIEYNNMIKTEKGRTNPTLSTLYKISWNLHVKLTDIVDIEE